MVWDSFPKMMLQRFSLALLALFIPLASAATIFAQEDAEKIPISVFVREECQHCQDEEKFLAELAERRTDFVVEYHDLAVPAHRAHFDALTELENISKSTPITIVGNTIIQGFDVAETTGARIVELLDASHGQNTFNFAEFMAAGGSSGEVETVAGGVCDEDDEACEVPATEMIFRIPFFGPVDFSPFSLPVLSGILGLIDGFNPCAMWVLVTFLIVLVQIGNRRRMWQIAGLFILAETVMYYLILNVWFTAWDFIGLDQIITPIVGVVAVGGGVFFLYEGLTSDGTCKVTNAKQRQKIHSRIRSFAENPLTWLAAAGVIGLALSVNVIEFACSIGIPQAFTKILEINSLTVAAEQGLMLIYILFYMLDDLVVFGIALWGVQHFASTVGRYSKYANLIGGVLMLVLGALLIFAPHVLRFM